MLGRFGGLLIGYPLPLGFDLLVFLLSELPVGVELWEVLGERPTVSDQPWPQYDPEHVASERLTIPIQVNGKLRSRIEVPADATEEDIVARAKEDAKLAEWLQGKTTRKVIYVKHKLVNFVV